MITTTVSRIQLLASELDQLGESALEKAAEAGRLLIECKKEMGHGQWLPWLEENFSFTDRTARRWMKLAEDMASGKLKSDTVVSSLAAAYRITTKRRPEVKIPPFVKISPFEMPLVHQRMFLISSVGSGGLAVIEPIDETYSHVTYVDLDVGEVCGTTRGIRSEYAFHFLAINSGKSWEDAAVMYLPWIPKGIGPNANLTAADPIAWIPKVEEAA